MEDGETGEGIEGREEEEDSEDPGELEGEGQQEGRREGPSEEAGGELPGDDRGLTTPQRYLWSGGSSPMRTRSTALAPPSETCLCPETLCSTR